MSVRTKFGLDADEYSNSTRIIIVKVSSQSSIGLIVDEVKEVIQLSEDQIQTIVKDVSDEKAFFSGVGKMKNDELVTLLNLEGVIPA